MYLTRITLTAMVALLGPLVTSPEIRAEETLVNCDISFTKDASPINISTKNKSVNKIVDNSKNNIFDLDQHKEERKELSIYEDITFISLEFPKEYHGEDCLLPNFQEQEVASEEQTNNNESDDIDQENISGISRIKKYIQDSLQNLRGGSEEEADIASNPKSQDAIVKTENADSSLEGISTKSIPNADQINQNIQDRYYGLVEDDGEKVDLFTNSKLTKELIESQEQNLQEGESDQNVQQEVAKENLQGIIEKTGAIENTEVSNQEDNESPPEDIDPKFFLTIIGVGCLIALPVATTLWKSKFSKPKVPDSIIDLHKKYFRKLLNFGNKATRIDDEKFGKEEFKIYFNLRHKVEAETAGYEKIGQSIKYLEVAIAAQSSYIKLESTELRYRSRKQQAFYEFVTSNIRDEIDKDEFRTLVKKKLAEVAPLIASEEGRNALKSYLKEINKIAEHDLGLKLLALFKKYQLADFTILRKVADIVERVNAQDVISEQNLTVIVLENYDTLKKLAPIIEIAEEDISPETFTKILQFMGLITRHGTAYNKFQDLLKVLRKWQEPSESLKLLREQYSKEKYQLPEEFTASIPGQETYSKYAKYLDT